MNRQFTTGQFAKLAHVSERTIRYYDKIGLLKPTFIMENGYRKYSEDDVMKLQKIISLKHFGFSLDDIKAIVVHDHLERMKDSLDLQMQLLDKKIKHLTLLKESMEQTKYALQNKALDWEHIMYLTQLCSQGEKIVEHYRDATNLAVRIKLHQQYSTNKQDWFSWLREQIDVAGVNRLLEIGCGDGSLWKSSNVDLRNREIFLSDASQGMLDRAKEMLGDDFSYMHIEAQEIPFKKAYFDAVVANHVLFYLHDIDAGLQEIQRVLRDGGTLYCSTYGAHHMEEITQLVKAFDERITLSDQQLFDVFGLANGEHLLRKYFSDVTCVRYHDSLCVDEVMPIYDYIMSCHGNQKEMLADRIQEFKCYLQDNIALHGKICIKKDAGLFICKKTNNKNT